MYKYAREIKFDSLRIEPLTNDNKILVDGFYSNNDVIDNFFKKEALTDTKVATHLIIDSLTNDLISFFSLSASGISINMSSQKLRESINRFNIPAIEINYFAIDKKYRHLFYDEITEKENEEYFLSDMLFEKILELILEFRKNIGFSFITLYSVPNSKNPNKPLNIYTRFNFETFEEYMEANKKRYLEGCIPMYIKI